MSDDNYLSFLDKANADRDAGQQPQPQTQSQSQSQSQTRTLDADAQIPASLTSVDAYYISDADEPFEPVVLKWDGAAEGSWPGASQLSSLISSPATDLSSAIEALSFSAFDPRGQYASVQEAVRAAAAGDEENVKVYRVETGGARVEYYVLGLDVKGRRVVGLRARAVES